MANPSVTFKYIRVEADGTEVEVHSNPGFTISQSYSHNEDQVIEYAPSAISDAEGFNTGWWEKITRTGNSLTITITPPPLSSGKRFDKIKCEELSYRDCDVTLCERAYRDSVDKPTPYNTDHAYTYKEYSWRLWEGWRQVFIYDDTYYYVSQRKYEEYQQCAHSYLNYYTIALYFSEPTFHVNVSVEGLGTASANKNEYALGENVTLSAQSTNEYYSFGHWRVGSNDYSNSLTSNPYTWKIGYEDDEESDTFAGMDWTAVLDYAGPTYTFTTSSESENRGGGYCRCYLTAAGSSTEVSTLSNVKYGESVTIVAWPQYRARQCVMYIRNNYGVQIDNPNITNAESVSSNVTYTFAAEKDETWTALLVGYVTVYCYVNGAATTRVGLKNREYGYLEPLPTPRAPQGQKFVGWFTAESGGDAVTNETVVTNGRTTTSVSIYAHFEEGEESESSSPGESSQSSGGGGGGDYDSSITYIADGWSNVPLTQYYNAIEGTEISSEVPTNSDYWFLGWCRVSSADVVDFKPGDRVSINDPWGSGIHLLYAVKTPKSGTFDTTEQLLDKDPPPWEASEYPTLAGTWTVTEAPSSMMCTGSIGWTLSNVPTGISLTSITFFGGNIELGTAYAESGTLTGLTWNMESPPDKAKVYWITSELNRAFTVTAEDESDSDGITEGGTVSISPYGVTSVTVADDTPLSLVATPSTDWKFLYWRKAGESVNRSLDAIYSLTADESDAGDYVAYFKDNRTKYNVTLSISPSAASTSGVTVSGAGKYRIGDRITFTATENSDYEFVFFKMRGYSFTSEDYQTKSGLTTTFSWVLSAQDVSMTTSWIAMFKVKGMYQVLTRVNIWAGQLTKVVGGTPTDTTLFAPGTEMTLVAAQNSTVSQGTYACLYISDSTGLVKKRNTHLAYGAEFDAGLTYEYTVESDEVWTANFAQYVTMRAKGTQGAGNLLMDYQEENSPISGTKTAMNVIPGKSFGYAESLPTPSREGYYFQGWYTESEGGDRIDNDTTVPEAVKSSSGYTIYAQWVSLSTKYKVKGVTQQTTAGAVTVNTPERGYYIGGETSTVSMDKADTWAAHLYVFEKTQYVKHNVGYDIDRLGAPFSFVVSDHADWEEDDSSDSDAVSITIRLEYKNEGVLVKADPYPPGTTLGVVDFVAGEGNLSHYYLPDDDVQIKGIPMNNGQIVRWEQKVHGGAWEKYPYVPGVDTMTFVAGEGGSEIRCVFGEQGTITYNANGGGGTVPAPQTFKTYDEITLATGLGMTKSGYAFIGWADTSTATEPQYLGGQQSVVFTTTPITLYAVWYKTPQDITNIMHCDTETGDDYSDTQADVQFARVSDIVATSVLGTLQGEMTWKVVLPSSLLPDESTAGGDDSDTGISAHFSKITVGTTPRGSDIYETRALEMTSDGPVVKVPADKSIETDWYFTVWYTVSNRCFAIYNANGGENAPPRQAFERGKSFKISMQVPTYEGHVFKGWLVDDPSISTLFLPGDTYNGLSPETGFSTLGDILFMAHWDDGVEVPVVHHNNTTDKDSPTPLSFTQVTVSMQQDQGGTKQFTFNWKIVNVEPGYTLAKTSTIVIKTPGNYNAVDSTATEGTSVYRTMANFTTDDFTAIVSYFQDTYTLEYDTQGGMPTIPSQSIPSTDEDGVLRISDLSPKKRGYDFVGWARSASATTAEYKPGDNIKMTESVTLYAVYAEEESDSESSGSEPEPEPSDISTGEVFTVYGKPDSVTHGTVVPKEVFFETGDTISFSATAKEGYEFSHWISSKGGVPLSQESTYSFIGEASLSGTTYTAVFNSKEVTIQSGIIHDSETGKLWRSTQDGKDYLIWYDSTAQQSAQETPSAG